MARKYAPLKLSINDDPGVDELTADAQWLYFRVMLTHPTMNACGVMDWRPKRLLRKASDMTYDRIRAAAEVLERRRFAMFDLVTEEALVRTYVRHDESLRNPKATVAVIRAYQDVASPELRAAIVTGIAREREDHPDYSSWTSPISAEGLSRILSRPGSDSVPYVYAYVEPIAEESPIPTPVTVIEQPSEPVRFTNPAPVPNGTDITNAGSVANGIAGSVPNGDYMTDIAGGMGDSDEGDYQSDCQSESVHFLPATRPPTTHDPSPGGLRNGGTSPRAHVSASDAAPSQFCPAHPLGTTAACRACGDARRRFEAWQAEQPDPAAERRRARRATLDACRECDAQGWRQEPTAVAKYDLAAIRCDHTEWTVDDWLARVPAEDLTESTTDPEEENPDA
ncbi:hypothetical protein [Nocardia niigatensis]